MDWPVSSLGTCCRVAGWQGGRGHLPGLQTGMRQAHGASPNEDLEPTPSRRGSPRALRRTSWSPRRGRQRSMRHTRIIVTHYGSPEELRVVEEECPAPKHREVRVLAAGVSLPDVMMREGRHPKTPRLPFTPGWDLVGVVDRLGAGVSGLAPGQGVAALPITGAYAEFVCLPHRELVPV